MVNHSMPRLGSNAPPPNAPTYLEAIHLFVEILDHFFSNVCELVGLLPQPRPSCDCSHDKG